MRRSKQFKYLIPLVFGALMVAAVIPVHATDVSLVQSSSEVLNNHNARWVYEPTEPSYDVSSGDRLIWLNWLYHGDSVYQSNYQAGVFYKYDSGDDQLARDLNNNVLVFMIGYQQQASGYGASTVQSVSTPFTRWHEYYYSVDWSLYNTSKHDVQLT